MVQSIIIERSPSLCWDREFRAVSLGLFSFLTIRISKVWVPLSLGSGQSEQPCSFLPAHVHSTAWGWLCCIRVKVRAGQLSQRQDSHLPSPDPHMQPQHQLDRRPPTPSVKVSPRWASWIASRTSLLSASRSGCRGELRPGPPPCRICRWAVLQGLEGMSAVMGLLPGAAFWCSTPHFSSNSS